MSQGAGNNKQFTVKDSIERKHSPFEALSILHSGPFFDLLKKIELQNKATVSETKLIVLTGKH